MTKDIVLSEPQRIQVRNQIQQVAAPSGISWDFNTYPVNIYKDGPRHFMSDIDLRGKVASDIWNGPEYWVDTAGSNANNGTSVSTPVRDIWKARYLLEASVSLGGIIHVKADPTLSSTWWGRTHDFNDTAGSGGSAQSSPTKPVALMGYGGLNFMGAIHEGATWTFDATSKAYSTSRSNVACVLDITGYNRFGVFKRLIRIAGGADLAATRTAIQTDGRTGIYAVSTANDLCIRLDSDTVVNDTNVKVCLNVAALKTGTPDFYAAGFNFVSSSNTAGVVNNTVTATHNVVFEDCDASYGGVDLGGAANSWANDNMTGFLGMRRCSGYSSNADIGNLHQAAGQMHALFIDFNGQDAGHDVSTPVTLSDQIVTIHDTVRLISLNTNGKYSSGCCVRNINSSEHWDLGSEYGYDRGDLRFSGGTIPSTGVSIEDTSKYWGDSITVRGCQRTFNMTSSAQLKLRDPIEMGGARSGAGTITTY